MILTREYIKSLEREYERQQLDIKRRLHKIKEGHPFGEPASQDGYYPATLLEVLDEETGLISYKEDSTGHTYENNVTYMYVED